MQNVTISRYMYSDINDISITFQLKKYCLYSIISKDVTIGTHRFSRQHIKTVTYDGSPWQPQHRRRTSLGISHRTVLSSCWYSSNTGQSGNHTPRDRACLSCCYTGRVHRCRRWCMGHQSNQVHTCRWDKITLKKWTVSTQLKNWNTEIISKDKVYFVLT